VDVGLLKAAAPSDIEPKLRPYFRAYGKKASSHNIEFEFTSPGLCLVVGYLNRIAKDWMYVEIMAATTIDLCKTKKGLTIKLEKNVVEGL